MLLRGIYCPHSGNVRRYFNHSFYLLGKTAAQKQENQFNVYMIELLLKNLPEAENKLRFDCNEYFILLRKLIKETFAERIAEDEYQAPELDFSNLLTVLVDKLCTHSSTETRYLPKNDQILIGYMQLLNEIITVRP